MELFRSKFLSLRSVEYTDRKGKTRTWEYVARANNVSAVAVLAFDKKERIILIKQKRHPINAYVIELPAGLVDQGESIIQAGIRELREETGFIGSNARLLGKVYSSPGLTSEYVNIISCDIIGEEGTELEDSEEIEVLEPVSIYGIQLFLKERIELHDEIVDVKVYAALGMLGI